MKRECADEPDSTAQTVRRSRRDVVPSTLDVPLLAGERVATSGFTDGIHAVFHGSVTAVDSHGCCKVMFDDGEMKDMKPSSLKRLPEPFVAVVKAEAKTELKMSKTQAKTEVETEVKPDVKSELKPPQLTTHVKRESEAKPAPQPVFSEDNFGSKNIIHLNTLIRPSAKMNNGFAAYIHEGVATHGIPIEITGMCPAVAAMQGQPHAAVKTALLNELLADDPTKPITREEQSWTNQTAHWLASADVGSFLIIRHIYGTCPYLPVAIKRGGCKHNKRIYAIGMVTETPRCNSLADRAIQDQMRSVTRLWHEGEQSNQNWFRVSYEWMGYYDDLSDTTRSYLQAISQPTVTKLFGTAATQKNEQAIRADLWKNAAIRIKPADFRVAPTSGALDVD